MNVSRKLLLATGASLGATALMPRAAYAAADVRIGVVASLTGPAAAFARDYVDGFKAYVGQWNARRGYRGRNVALEILDDETNPVSAVTAFRRLTADAEMPVMWIATSSGSALAIKPLSTEAKIPIVSSGAIDQLGTPPAPYFFKLAPSSNDFVLAVLRWAQASSVKRIAVLNATDAYGQSELAFFNDNAAKHGVTVVARESFAVTDTDFAPQLTRIRNANADIAYSGAVGAPAILIFKQYKQLDLKPPLAVSQGALNTAFFSAIGGPKAADGLFSPTQLGSLQGAAGGEEARLYQQCASAVGHPATVFNSFGWDHGILTEHALATSDGSRDGIRNALERTRDLTSINGPISYSAQNHTGQDVRGIRMARMVDGKFIVAR